MDISQYLIIFIAALIAAASPGPATVAIANTSLSQGKRAGQVLVLGISTASVTWALLAGLGFSAILLTHTWVIETVRILGACYLMFLAWQSLRSAIKTKQQELITETKELTKSTAKALYQKGLALHITNPKAMLFFGSLYSVGLPATASVGEVFAVSAMVVLQGFLIFQTYAIVFSIKKFREGYFKLKRYFDLSFSAVFGAAGLGLLSTKLQS